MGRTSDSGLIRSLVEDAIEAATLADLGSPASRRNLVRTTYAAIEGIAWHLAEHVSSIAKDLDSLTAAEELALSERSYQVTKQGKVSEQVRYIPLPSLVRLSANIATRIDPTLGIDFQGLGWNRFLAGLEVRNRITHPKRIDDLDISDADVAATMASLHWMLELTEGAIASAVGALRMDARQLEIMIRKLEAGDPQTWSDYLSAKQELDDD